MNKPVPFRATSSFLTVFKDIIYNFFIATAAHSPINITVCVYWYKHKQTITIILYFTEVNMRMGGQVGVAVPAFCRPFPESESVISSNTVAC